MREFGYYYKDKKGKLCVAVDSNVLIGGLITFWILPLILIFHFLWHFFSGNVKLLTKEEYHKLNYEYYKKLAQIKKN